MMANHRNQYLAWLLLCLGIFAPFLVAADGDRTRTLHVYTWLDYFDSDVINEFQKLHNCRVVIDIFDSNEMMLLALKYDSSGYDVMTPSSYMCAILWEQAWLMELDHSKLPNLHNLVHTSGREYDPGMKYSVPYTLTVTGVGYNRKEVPQEFVGSWNIFSAHALAGRMTMLTDFRECLGAALLMLGYSPNTTEETEIIEAGKVVRQWRQNLAGFNTDGGKLGLAAGDYAVTHGYNGDMLQAMAENPDVSFFVPEEGSTMTWDEMVIPVDTREPDLAHAFINHMMDPEMARRNMEGTQYYMPNGPALEKVGPRLRDNPAFSVDAEVLSRCEPLRVVGEHKEKYIRVWRDIVMDGESP